MSNFKKEISALYVKHKQELQTSITNYLNTNFKEFFEKHPAATSVKINVSQSYNDNDYSTVVHYDSESIKINGYNYMDLEDTDWDDDEVVENIGLTTEQHENMAGEASEIFTQISSYILSHVYGDDFGLKIERLGITLETSDVESY